MTFLGRFNDDETTEAIRYLVHDCGYSKELTCFVVGKANISLGDLFNQIHIFVGFRVWLWVVYPLRKARARKEAKQNGAML